MKISIDEVLYQTYLLPYVKVTYTRILNGHKEFILGWFRWQLVIMI